MHVFWTRQREVALMPASKTAARKHKTRVYNSAKGYVRTLAEGRGATLQQQRCTLSREQRAELLVDVRARVAAKDFELPKLILNPREPTHQQKRRSTERQLANLQQGRGNKRQRTSLLIDRDNDSDSLDEETRHQNKTKSKQKTTLGALSERK
eukprot:m.97640 g.97640  ORF g.97640 m.97640 type:complete len:153 (+) comp15229_c0_seq1:121-579(+)